MESSLIDIKEHVKKYANVITSLINVDVGIVDKNPGRIPYPATDTPTRIA